MLKIRDEHLNALGAQQAAGFVRRMAAHLREVFPAEVAGLDDARLLLLVQKVCARAEEWGITQEAHVERFLELFVAFDPLRRNPPPEWIGAIVREHSECGEQILIMLEDRLLFEERA